LIDVFKIDIEGSEFKFFSSIFQSSKASYPRQILVEIHPKTTPDTHCLFDLFSVNESVSVPWIFYRHHFGIALIQLPIFLIFSHFFSTMHSLRIKSYYSHGLLLKDIY
jgi:hypothetical protein